MDDLFEIIISKCDKEPGLGILKDLYAIGADALNYDTKLGREYLRRVSDRIEKYIVEAPMNQVSELYDLHGRTLLAAAPYDLDSYQRYLEWDRPPQEKFYEPRREIMSRLCHYMQMLEDNELDELFLSMPPRCGKLLADDTPVLTTKGWKNHGDLVVGDMVFTPDGNPVPVIGVLPKHHTTHTVTFTDGSQIKCHFRHEWKVFDRHRNKWRIIETQEMIGKLEGGIKEKVRGHRYMYQIEQKEPLRGVPVELHVNPYALGAWLGDGHNISPRITCPDREVPQALVDAGYKITYLTFHKDTLVPSWDFADLRSQLQKYGMCYSNRTTEKHIPEEYIYAPIKDRLELLAGLLDTDGSLVRKEHRYHFSTTSARMRDSFLELIATFGWRTSVKEEAPKVSTSGIKGNKTVYVIAFNPTMEIPCRVPRKHLDTFSKPRSVSIKSIEPSELENGNCITVLGGMYLAGRNLTPTHNTTMLMFYVSWLIGRNSEKSNLYCAYSDIITSAFYNGVLELITDPVTYKWRDIFPSAKIAATNAKDETLNIDRKKRYPSLTCRSLYGTLNGAVDANGVLISDDLIGGIEEALNKDRLVSAWSKVENNLLTRAKEQAKILWCGTRWSLGDPIGQRMELVVNDPKFKDRRYRIINLPALDEHDHSNFKYHYGVGFSDAYFIQKRASFERNNDMASWEAQYMQQPIERSGALFESGDMKFYNGVLPDESHLVRKFMHVDPAFGGGDFVAAPVGYLYDDGSLYIPDVVYTDGDKTVSQPMIADKIFTHKLHAARFEANKSTEGYKDGVEELLKSKNFKLNITTKPAPNNVSKEVRIFDKAPEIRKMYFLEDGKRTKEYSMFMNNVFSFKMTGKNKHDDAPDSLAGLVDMMQDAGNVIEFRKRPF